ncbi:AAA family ATPase [Streptomyces sp. NPDC046409]|uniref:helix-turn-helix transcriptional regulator n=1 Tax=Streptomyces sp. NPDC046409 TaxID=3156675 RepID=UPI0033FDDFBD
MSVRENGLLGDGDGGPELLGRSAERAVLSAALAGAGDAVLLRGDPGIGKTSLLEWAVRRARAADTRVLRMVGAAAESGLAYAALHQVLWPLLDESAGLPPAQQDALERALGVREGAPPDGFALGDAALGLLARTAARRPLLVVLDDLQWADETSAAVFAFLQRRIERTAVVLLAATRDAEARFDGPTSTVVDVGRLSSDEAGVLVDSRCPGLESGVRDRILHEAGGNPLALTELPLQLDPDVGRGVLPLPDHLPVGTRLGRMFDTRIARLSSPARDRLLRLALGEAWRGADLPGARGQVPRPPDDDGLRRELTDSGLAVVDPTTSELRFRHPLVASCVVELAPKAAVRKAHLRIAALLPPDHPQRALHLSAGTVDPDEATASCLERAAEEMAQRRGDVEAARLYGRAAELSGSPSGAVRRWIMAASLATRGTAPLDFIRRLLDEVARHPVPGDLAVLHQFSIAFFQLHEGSDYRAPAVVMSEILDGLGALPQEEPGGLRDSLFCLLILTTVYTGDDALWRNLDRHIHQASPLAALCYDVWKDPARTAHGAAERLRPALATLTPHQEAMSVWLILWTAVGADVIGEHPELLQRLQRQHLWGTRSFLDLVTCRDDVIRGRWESALRTADRGARESAARGFDIHRMTYHLHAGFVLAGRGEADALDSLHEQLGPWARERGLRFLLDGMHAHRSLLALGAGRYEDAYAHAAAVTPPGTLPARVPWFLHSFLDLVEAAAHTGREEQARAHVDAAVAAGVAEISGHHAFTVSAAAAVVARDDARFRAALARPGAEQWPFTHARLHLAYGGHLRRRSRRKDAVSPLLEARRIFAGLGAVQWVAAADRELSAAGGAVPPTAGRGAEWQVLTAQERRIADLAACGLTNREIANRVRVSPRTVGAHLYRIFPKLGVTSRAALSEALADNGARGSAPDAR